MRSALFFLLLALHNRRLLHHYSQLYLKLSFKPGSRKKKHSPASKQLEKSRSPPVARTALNRDTVAVPLVYLPRTEL